MCIAAHKFFDADDGEIPCVYRCTLRASEDQIIAVGDWRTPNHAGALRAYLRHLNKEDDFLVHYRDIMNRDNSRDELQALSFERLKGEMIKRHHRALGYLNVVEGPEPSLMVIDPDDVAVNACAELDWREVVEAFRKTSWTQFGLSERSWQQAQEAAAQSFSAAFRWNRKAPLTAIDSGYSASAPTAGSHATRR